MATKLVTESADLHVLPGHLKAHGACKSHDKDDTSLNCFVGARHVAKTHSWNTWHIELTAKLGPLAVFV